MKTETEDSDGAVKGAGATDLLLLKGLGKDLWQGVDVQRYINELREEWDSKK